MEILLQGLYKASQDENEQVVKEVTGKRMVELSTCTICKILYLQMYFNGLVQIWANLGRGVVPYALHLGMNCLWVSLEKQNKKPWNLKKVWEI